MKHVSILAIILSLLIPPSIQAASVELNHTVSNNLFSESIFTKDQTKLLISHSENDSLESYSKTLANIQVDTKSIATLEEAFTKPVSNSNESKADFISRTTRHYLAATELSLWNEKEAVAAGKGAEAPIRKLFLEEVNLGEIDWSSWQQLEKAVREYHGAVPFNQRTYVGLVDGIPYNGIADNVVKIDGIDIAIEAKYCKDWSKSLRNPASSIGTKPFAIAEQEKMILQARKYSDAFKNGKIRYYTNSRELAEYYTDQFKKYNLANIEFIIVK